MENTPKVKSLAINCNLNTVFDGFSEQPDSDDPILACATANLICILDPGDMISSSKRGPKVLFTL